MCGYFESDNKTSPQQPALYSYIYLPLAIQFQRITFTFHCLLKIGDHITEITSHYKEGDVVTEWRK